MVEYQRGDERWVDDVASRTDAARRVINRLMPDALLAELRIVVAPTKRDFLALAGGWAEHASAVALRTRGAPTVIINAEVLRQAGPTALSQTLVHELAHCYLGLRAKAPFPRWFEEGVARIAADEVTFEDSLAVALAAVFRRTIPLRDLSQHFPADPQRQRLAYQQSSSVVRLLIEEQGGSLSKLLGAYLGDGGERRISELWNPLLVDALDLRWRSTLRSWRSFFLFTMSSGLFWGGVALLTILAWAFKRWRNAQRRREWEEEEKIFTTLEEEEKEVGTENEDSQEEDEEEGPRPPWYG